MNKHRKSTASLLSQADEKCTRSGSRLTTKRAQVLEVLLSSAIPLSAYEIVARYNQATEQTMQPMSVYRILQFLESEELVHKLSVQNKYIACSHIACSHPHEVPQFLICRNCQRTEEISIQKSVIDEIAQQAEKSGFQLMNSQIELDCLCAGCLEEERTITSEKKTRTS
jgi:Fur family zinc uptake transcriptional regulator